MTFSSIDNKELRSSFKETLPTNFLGGFQIFFALFLFSLWMGRIIPSLKGATPVGLNHYTSLVIQGMDLGYLITSIVITKGFTLGAALTAIVFGQVLAHVKMELVEILMFPLFSLINIYCFYQLIKNLKENNI